MNGAYFLSPKGLFKLVTPFEVICVKDIKNIKVGDKIIVAQVKSTNDGQLVYEIQGELYYWFYFTTISRN